MCKAKADGERCFGHAYEDYVPNAERVERDERITRNGQKLNREERTELRELTSRTDKLEVKEKNRISILERIRADNSKLTPQEAKVYTDNLAKKERLEASMNAGAVVGGALRRKELSLVRGDVLDRFAKDPKALESHPNRNLIKRFIARREENRDTPLTQAEAELADDLYFANPKKYNPRHEMLGGDGRRRPLTEKKYMEQVEAVQRYEFLNPKLSPPDQRNVYAAISRLRRDPAAFKEVLSNVFGERRTPEGLPKEHAAVIQSGSLTPRGVTLAIAQDERVVLYGLLAEKGSAQTRLYATSVDREAMDAARKLIPKDKDELSVKRLAERQRRLVAWEERIRNEEWASSAQEVVFSSSQPQPPAAKAVPAKQSARSTKQAAPAASSSATTPASGGSQGTTTQARSTGGSSHSDKQDQRKFTRNGREFGPPDATDADAVVVATPPPATASPAATQAPVASRPSPTPAPQTKAADPRISSRELPALPSSPAKAKRTEPQRPSVIGGASLERPREPRPAEVKSASVTPPPVVGGDDFLHRLQRLFKRSN